MEESKELMEESKEFDKKDKIEKDENNNYKEKISEKLK